MSKCYTINDNISFYPESGTLLSSLGGARIKLNVPTAQLLEAFVNRVGVIISQSDLYLIAWGDNGVNVTPNTLYQNISLLRKALQDIGLSGETITTVRGKGFIFTVTKVAECEVEIDPAPEEDEVIVENIAPQQQDKKIVTKNKYNIVLLSASVLILFGAVFYFIHKSIPKRIIDYPKNFTFLSKIDGCSIFTSTDLHNLESQEKINTFLSEQSLECNTYPYIYLNYTIRHPTISVISCEFEVNYSKKNNCRTEIFVNHGGFNEIKY
ncbi:Transcriptional regulatory protein%2C C terminal [Yersinia massiliensis]|uniref:winged helix-turn-helix domain-containing protein n=1 Tax=Yersinia massiliensis TaxID=419257 RepID=UPI0005DF98CC|nr:winged helix-turn-helix domain-containing protein [Yersinia massiliensis]CNI09425.1 Transcriptional regulatory protein%2C C terminal [Yersinia massiliensis]